MSEPVSSTGGQLLVRSLLAHGTDLAFCVPGESYLPVLDALYDVRERLRLIVCRHEGGAAYMAEAYGKLTGRPGVALVTRGPGASNACVGVHTAQQDSSPMILLVGQVRLRLRKALELEEVEKPDQRERGQTDHDHERRVATDRLPLAKLGGKEVDLAHAGLRWGIASPTATLSTASASDAASAVRSSSDFARSNSRPRSTGTGRRSWSSSSSPSSREPPPTTSTRPI